MPRLSDIARAEAARPVSDAAFLILLTAEHAQLSEPVRVVANTVDIHSRGQRFIAMGFTVALPGQGGDRAPVTRLQIANVGTVVDPASGDRFNLVQTLRRLHGDPPALTLEVVLSDTPDLVEMALSLDMTTARYDRLTIDASVDMAGVWGDRFPAARFAPGLYPLVG